MNKTWIRILLIGLLLALVAGAFAQSMQIPKLSVELGGTKNGNQVSSSLQILALLTVLSLAPAILILTTAFTRITIVLSFARNAIGAQNIPPNQVMIGLSLFLTFFVMGPTLKEINTTAIQPLSAGKIQFDQALTNAQKPMRAFMIKNTYEKDLILFLNISKSKPKSREDVEMTALIPAFIISELKTAFIIGFYIFVPFLIIDLIVASGLMTMRALVYGSREACGSTPSWFSM